MNINKTKAFQLRKRTAHATACPTHPDKSAARGAPCAGAAAPHRASPAAGRPVSRRQSLRQNQRPRALFPPQAADPFQQPSGATLDYIQLRNSVAGKAVSGLKHTVETWAGGWLINANQLTDGKFENLQSAVTYAGGPMFYGECFFLGGGVHPWGMPLGACA